MEDDLKKKIKKNEDNQQQQKMENELNKNERQTNQPKST